MRAFVNSILDFIVAASLTDEEFSTITEEAPVYSLALYEQMLAILDSRETISSTRERLRAYFISAGVDIPEDATPSTETSNILIGIPI